MLDIRKAAAAALCAVVLGGQTLAVFARTSADNSWYWPFVDYPMYSTAHDYSDVVLYYELRAQPCGSADTVTLSFDHLMDRSSLQALLYQMSNGDTQSRTGAGGVVDHLLASRTGPAMCSAQLWEYRHFIAWEGYRGQSEPPRLVRAWDVPHDDASAAARAGRPASASR